MSIAAVSTEPMAPAPARKASDPAYSLELLKPIEAHGEQLTVLNFREPTARDLLLIGNPVNFDPISDPPKITHDGPKMAAMMSALSNVPPSSIQQLTTREIVTISWGLTPFFAPLPGKV